MRKRKLKKAPMKILLVIDMLEDFFREGLLHEKRSDLTANINTLVKQCRERDVPVVWIRQEFKEDLSDAFLIMKKEKISITIAGTKGSEILSELEKSESEYEFVKKRYSPFFDTGLEDHLKAINATELLLVGVNTHACIRTTAIDAYQRDYEVTIPLECVASNDEIHHNVTLDYLDGHIVKLVSMENIWSEGAL